MAHPMIRATYTLQPKTISRLEWLASRWKIPKSEAISRIINERAEAEAKSENSPLQALRELRQHRGLSSDAATAWIAQVRRDRDESSDDQEKKWPSFTSTPTT
jgi:hypothetical protein